jgi:electron transfer flavoprotein beta subunit
VNIVVCVKPVPDTSVIMFDPKTGLVDSDDLVYVINPCDVVAVEEAVRIKERCGPGRVILLSVAPPSTRRLIRSCLAMGADEARLLWDSDFADLDSYATGAILAGAISSIPHDLILCGQKAADTEAGQVGSVIADSLNLPLATRAVKIDVLPDGKKMNVESKLEKGKRLKMEVALPALLTVEPDLNEPRYAGLPSLMAALKKDIQVYDLKSLGLSHEETVAKGINTRTVALSAPKPRPKKVFTPDSRLSAEERLRLIISGGVTQKQSDVLQGNPDNIASTVVQFLKSKNFIPTTEHSD